MFDRLSTLDREKVLFVLQLKYVKISQTSMFDRLRTCSLDRKKPSICTATALSQSPKIELNKRFGTPFYIPMIGLIICFLLSSRKDKKIYPYSKYILGGIGFLILTASEITVRYSGLSLNNLLTYYLFPVSFVPITYFFLMRTFKYENLN